MKLVQKLLKLDEFLPLSHVSGSSDDDEFLFDLSQVTPTDELNEMLQYLYSFRIETSFLILSVLFLRGYGYHIFTL